MGCYGIGISRVMGTIAELLSDESGLIWPENIAPARIIVIRIGENPEVIRLADKLYENLLANKIEVIYDDRDLRAGEKFSDADLLGIPCRIVISDKTLESKKFEFKNRSSDSIDYISEADLLKKLSKNQ